MRTRIPVPLSLLVLALVAALALGTVGTATAGGLTTNAVKKIATKVVKKKAKTLTVASATTATNAANAANLAGQPASAYQDVSNVYSVVVPATTSSVDAILPLTAGKVYQISYSAYLAGGSDAACYLFVYNDAAADVVFYTADSSGDATTNPAHSGVGVVAPAAGQTTHFYCGSDSGFTTIADEPIQIVVTQLDAIAVGGLAYTTAKAAARPSR